MQAHHYREAKRRVDRRLGLYIHLCVYLVVNTGLVLLNLLLTRGIAWSLAPLLGWGVGLLFHALAVFLNGPCATWKERMIEHELKKMK